MMRTYQECLGYDIPHGGKEGRAAKKLLEAGYTPEQVAACYRHLKADPWWKGKHLSLHTVYEQIGAYVAESGGAPGDPYAPRTHYNFLVV